MCLAGPAASASAAVRATWTGAPAVRGRRRAHAGIVLRTSVHKDVADGVRSRIAGARRRDLSFAVRDVVPHTRAPRSMRYTGGHQIQATLVYRL